MYHKWSTAPFLVSDLLLPFTNLTSDKPRDVEITPDSVSVGDTLQCASDANPVVGESSYTWNISGKMYTGSEVELTAEHKGLQDVECCAKNEIGGTPYSECTWKQFDVKSKRRVLYMYIFRSVETNFLFFLIIIVDNVISSSLLSLM